MGKSVRRDRHQYKMWFTSPEREQLRARAREHDEKLSAYIRRRLGLSVPQPGPAPSADKREPSHVRRLHKK